MIIAPCATLITRMMPNASVSPLAMRAYTPPASNPKMTAWTNRRTAASSWPGAPALG